MLLLSLPLDYLMEFELYPSFSSITLLSDCMYFAYYLWIACILHTTMQINSLLDLFKCIVLKARTIHLFLIAEEVGIHSVATRRRSTPTTCTTVEGREGGNGEEGWRGRKEEGGEV